MFLVTQLYRLYLQSFHHGYNTIIDRERARKNAAENVRFSFAILNNEECALYDNCGAAM
jgi:hypothetical protein